MFFSDTTEGLRESLRDRPTPARRRITTISLLILLVACFSLGASTLRAQNAAQQAEQMRERQQQAEQLREEQQERQAQAEQQRAEQQERQQQAEQAREEQQERQQQAEQAREEQQQRQQEQAEQQRAQQERQQEAQQQAQQEREQQAQQERQQEAAQQAQQQRQQEAAQQAAQQREQEAAQQQAARMQQLQRREETAQAPVPRPEIPVSVPRPVNRPLEPSPPAARYPSAAPPTGLPVMVVAPSPQPAGVPGAPMRPTNQPTPSVVYAQPNPAAIAAANAQADAAEQQLLQAQMFQNYVARQAATDAVINQAADGIREIISQTTTDPALAQAMSDSIGQTDPISDAVLQQMQNLANVGTARAQNQAIRAGILPAGVAMQAAPSAPTATQDWQPGVTPDDQQNSGPLQPGPSQPGAPYNPYAGATSGAGYNPYSNTTAGATASVYNPYSNPGGVAPPAVTPPQASQATPCQWTQQTLNVSAWGQDTLYVHADVQTGILDAQGQPSFGGRTLTVTNGTQTQQHFYFGLNGALDHDLAPGQTVRLPVVAPLVNGNTEQPLVVRYCRV